MDTNQKLKLVSILNGYFQTNSIFDSDDIYANNSELENLKLLKIKKYNDIDDGIVKDKDNEVIDSLCENESCNLLQENYNKEKNRFYCLNKIIKFIVFNPNISKIFLPNIFLVMKVIFDLYYAIFEDDIVFYQENVIKHLIKKYNDNCVKSSAIRAVTTIEKLEERLEELKNKRNIELKIHHTKIFFELIDFLKQHQKSFIYTEDMTKFITLNDKSGEFEKFLAASKLFPSSLYFSIFNLGVEMILSVTSLDGRKFDFDFDSLPISLDNYKKDIKSIFNASNDIPLPFSFNIFNEFCQYKKLSNNEILLLLIDYQEYLIENEKNKDECKENTLTSLNFKLETIQLYFSSSFYELLIEKKLLSNLQENGNNIINAFLLYGFRLSDNLIRQNKKIKLSQLNILVSYLMVVPTEGSILNDINDMIDEDGIQIFFESIID